ncbi:MAG: bifunctional (p)ppGpp synthetase/guanosine-3',5'-bis(diphosphate) 3'-pyrophosphohydrolase [Planctomycetes bacterium]|nr:bifunctional (p)ppGpp synthetase/guanosine-3',5'-bis(diphosphate) 3'-pyrophosphohydrolase [Planctomycetota bacterium]
MTDSRAAFGQVLEAASFAARVHHGQLRKDRATPYVSHVFRVCLIVRDVFGFTDPRMMMAALLHDTIEDTTTDFDDLQERFGSEVAAWVAYLTKDMRLPEEVREHAYIEGLLKAPWQVQVCKLADIFDNLLDMAHLAAETRARSIGRAETYFAALRGLPAPEVQRPLALVEQALADVKHARV